MLASYQYLMNFFKLLMAGYEPGSTVGSDCSANCATTTTYLLLLPGNNS